ncbi:hypothetical protein LAZ67_7001272 [Cordylochernes scorpioides]|uniref:Transposase Tc1-like domain-containing protein n=1 Tax=Cordylochernes scorpioides TaxID=51811 RepID=A0ABY6KN33_9ARAC|nr:hypothetical protein LAZ67_7001272 [Cordylochernes scorpioides]
MKKISQLKEDIHRSHLKISLAIVLVLKTDDRLWLHFKALFKAWRFRQFQNISKTLIVPRLKQRSSFDQVSEFDRGRIVAYRDCESSFREIGSRVGRNQATVMRICDRWMQEGTTDRRVRSHPPQCTTSRGKLSVSQITNVAQYIQSVTHHPVSARTIRRRLQQSGLSARRPLLRLYLTQNHRRLRRQW